MRNQWIQGIRAVIGEGYWQPSKLPFTDPVHLAANSQGQLTPEQIQVLIKEKASQIRGIGCLLVYVSFLLSIMLFLAFLNPEFNHFKLFFLLSFLLLGCVFIGLGLVRQKNFREDLAVGRIVLSVIQLQGVIVWDQRRKGYWSHLSNALSLPVPHCFPGPYSFYFVEEEAKIVSLMPLHTPVQREQALLTVQMALCRTLGFLLSDLDANRRGLLSEKQRRRLRWEFYKGPLAVQSIEGEIHGTASYIHNAGNIYYYQIGGKSFLLARGTALKALVHRMRYRVYYLDGKLQKLLSVEPLEVLESSV